MKKNLLITLFFLAITASLFAEKGEIISYYFHKDALFELSSVSRVAPQQFGKYELRVGAGNEMRRAAGNYIYVDETGIYLKKNKLLNISREEVRENSKYTVRDNYIHGVVEKDSLSVALDGEDYYFLVPAKTYLIQNPGGADRMMQISKSRYAIFTYEDNGFYSGIIADFVAGGIELKDIVMSTMGDQSVEQIEKKEIQEAEENEIKTYILSPTKSEWSSIIFSKCLVTYDSYSRMSE